MINLHVMHSWGGGLERWVQDYCGADKRDTNFILKSVGESGVPARQICLYQHIDDLTPLRSWHLDKPILATAATHLEYRYILQEIIDVFQIDNILISSFIGHALELLQTNIHTAVICHDFYPFCPVIVAYFKGNCQECNFSHLKKCFAENSTQFFPFTSAIEWMEIRDVFISTLRKQQIQLIMPSPFMKKRLISLEPKLAEVPMLVISHGIPPLETVTRSTTRKLNSIKKKPRILILGDLPDHKGFELFSQICDRLGETTDFYLLGCGDSGKRFKHKSHVKIIPRYQRSELSSIIDELEIDLGLLLSIWTETFSYTLSELMSMGIPTLATNIGSFADRIEDGINGFLVKPVPEDIIHKINSLLKKDDVLKLVHTNLLDFKHKSVDKMVSEYQEQFDINLFKSKQIRVFKQFEVSSDDLNTRELYQELQLYREELTELRFSQAKILNQLQQKELYPNWNISKKSRKPISKRFEFFNYVKYLFPELWDYFRKLAMDLKLLR
jgi:glycosyltransferase involved in cell wall biosynthesis